MAETLGKYQLIEKIAQGGMAEVFLASQQSEIGGFSKRVAIKRMFPHLVERDEIITMFIDEARIASSLTHPSIVQIYDLGVVDGALYIAMEYVEGLDLRRLCEKGIEQDNFFSREMAVRIVADTAAGLHYAHTRLDEHGQPMNIVHRDISPQNILISVDGAVKICDFGIAKAESRLTDTLTGEFKGKFSYMSPEQFEGGDLDGQSDVFTLGIVFYEITVGTRLFRGKNEYDTMRMVTDARVTPPTEIRPDFPPDLERIILKSLQRDRRLRYKSAAEFHDDLEDWLYSNRLRVGPMQISRYIHSLLRGERGEDVPAPEALEPAPVKTAQVDETMPLTLSEDLIHELDAHYGVDGPAREDATVQDSVDRTSLSPMPTWENEEAEILGETRPELDSLSLGVEPPTNPIMQSLEEPEEDRTIVLDDIVVEDPTTGHHVKPHQVASALEADSSGKNEQFSTDPLFEIGRMAWTPRHLLIGAAGVAALLSVVMLVFFLFSGGEDLGENGGEGGAEPGSELAVSGNEIPLDDGEILAGPLLSHPTVEVRLESQPSGAYVVINGLLASGKTPGSFPLYEGLSNEIVFYSSDHQPLRLRMTAKADQETTRVELERARSQSRARIYLRSQPTGAVVFLNGMRLGTTPLRMENVEADHEHHIQMSLDDHFGFAGFVQLSQAMDNRVEAILDPVTSVSRQSFVELRFEVQPRGTRVDIEGDARGVSPFIDNHRRDHLLEVKFEGHQREPLTRLVATSEVGSFLFAPTLESIPQATGKVGLTVTPEAAIFIGSRAYGAGPVKNLDLPEGRHTVVFETVSGQRLRAQIEVKPNKANQFDVRLRDGKALVHVID